VTEIAHRMKLEVVAEGVETSAQRDWLKSHGVKWLQGYLYSRPLPLTDFLDWLQSGCPQGSTAAAVPDADPTGCASGRSG
ncbi:EAL domain-containing protein, partial [Enterobacter asburiae]|uniref:EAL domain-containing protein n=1 Tax=Enterobacter asburiae TaxID=61645 RepID=UPI0021CF57E2